MAAQNNVITREVAQKKEQFSFTNWYKGQLAKKRNLSGGFPGVDYYHA
jgi:hypothetical protein